MATQTVPGWGIDLMVWSEMNHRILAQALNRYGE